MAALRRPLSVEICACLSSPLTAQRLRPALALLLQAVADQSQRGYGGGGGGSERQERHRALLLCKQGGASLSRFV